MTAASDPKDDAISFALLGHPANYDHFCRLASVGTSSAAFKRLIDHRQAFLKLVELAPSYIAARDLRVPLAGRSLRGKLIICPFLPEQLTGPRHLKNALDKIEQGIGLAREIDVAVVALGGFTSILLGRPRARVPSSDAPLLTSGNSLTAALAIAQLGGVLRTMGRSLDSGHIAVIGATGDIGSTCASLLATQSRRVTLIARNKARLRTLADSLDGMANVDVSTDVQVAFRARVVVVATNSPTGFIDPASFRSGSIVCDIGYPKALAAENRRSDITVFGGGLARFPCRLDLQAYLDLPAADVLYGCFAEGIVLAAEPEMRRFAATQGGSTPKSAIRLLQAAEGLGIRAAVPPMSPTVASM